MDDAKSDTRPLLKVFHENCPGCKQEQKNEVSRGVPYRDFIFIWVVSLCSGKSIFTLPLDFASLTNVLALETRGQSLKIKTPWVDLVRVSYDERNAPNLGLFFPPLFTHN